MDGVPNDCIVVLTTNHTQNIDPAVNLCLKVGNITDAWNQIFEFYFTDVNQLYGGCMSIAEITNFHLMPILLSYTATTQTTRLYSKQKEYENRDYLVTYHCINFDCVILFFFVFKILWPIPWLSFIVIISRVSINSTLL